MEFKLKNGLIVEIREVFINDVQLVLDYMEIIHKQTKNLMREPDEFIMTFDEEYRFIEKVVKSNDQAMFVVFHKGIVISTSGIHGSSLKRIKHRVSLGISILEEYRGLGLGKKLMLLLIEKAENLGKLKIDLDVREDNLNAIKLYESVGFKHEGIKIDGFFVDDKFINLINMGLVLRR
jgi:RimJ/RimL family protein N-acetyltransferase